jgi:hypothetical protein
MWCLGCLLRGVKHFDTIRFNQEASGAGANLDLAAANLEDLGFLLQLSDRKREG